MQVIEDEEKWLSAACPPQEVTHAVEQVAALLLRRQLRGRRDVGEEAAELRHELGHLRGRVTQGVAQRLRRDDPRGGLSHLHEGDVGRRPLHLVATADEGGHVVLAGLGHQFLGDTRLADAGLAADHDEGATTACHLVEEAPQVGPLRLAADEGRPLDEGGANGRLLLLPDDLE